MLRHVGIRYKNKKHLNIVFLILLLCIIYNSECLPSPKYAGIFCLNVTQLVIAIFIKKQLK